ncbi:hypothetical protein [Sandaracinus amylolyticus]|uniref:hypothetical protein n=1 Tax=Sandaracinus amylolyticus TaxID=927083 RepID=UPI001F3FF0FF|nr:hypothetical protein [Sandaracinus amylolyticus]UJR84945.1 Hypothetical protein I5071_70240 [Sandaracinus amylolyticus]
MPTSTRRPVAIVGLGQLGATFGMGLLRLGRPVLPVLRGDAIDALVAHDPELVLVAVAEKDQSATFDAIPPALRKRIALVQNELLPPDWQAHEIVDPTVAVVWFEKKRGRGAKVVRTTRIGGPCADLLVRALESVDLPARRIDARDLTFELVRKDLYILGSNLAGLKVGGTTADLCTTHRTFVTGILEDVLTLDEARLGATLPREALIECAFLDFAKDPEHASTGRSAPERLARTLARAEALGVELPSIRALTEKR